MIRCACGYLNGDDDMFCGRDGQFLEHVGERVDEESPPETDAAPPVDLPAQVATTPEDAGATPLPGTVAPPPYVSQSPPLFTGGASAPDPPSDTPLPVEEEPVDEPVKVPPAPKPEPPEPIRPGDLICGKCGAGNAPDRNFCRSCGETLAEAEVQPEPAWWRRIFRRSPKPPPAAGDRPGKRRSGGPRRRRSPGRLLVGLAGLLAAALAVGALVPGQNPVKSLVGDVQDQAEGFLDSELTPVVPVGASATSMAPDTSPDAVIDGATNTWWSEGVPGNGEAEKVTLLFEGPTDIETVGFYTGTTRNPDEFRREPRPKKLLLRYLPDDTTHTIELEDIPDFQSFGARGSGVQGVEVQIISVYASGTGENTSIAEIEFFRTK